MINLTQGIEKIKTNLMSFTIAGFAAEKNTLNQPKET